MPTNPHKKPTAPKGQTIGSFDFKPEPIHISKLLLDPNNYRFLDHKKFKKKAANRFHEEAVQRATLDSLEQTYQLDELKQSILTNGYVRMERIIVVPYLPKPGLFLVVEGNRRVASLRSILKEDSDGVHKLGAGSRKSFSEIPCAVLKSTGPSLKHAERVIMGIRHIAGPREWGAYQQARLVSELKDEESLEFKDIGEMLGVSSVEAARRYRAIKALETMERDELYSNKAEPSFYRLFHELVALPDVRTRFGWSTEGNLFSDIEKARQFFELICSDGKCDAKIKTYGDVRKLKSIIGNSKAEMSLLSPEESFSDALRIGEQGKKPADASALLEEAKTTLAGIAILEAQNLNPGNIALIDELLTLLNSLRSMASANGTK